MEKDTGNVPDAAKLCDHPEVMKREAEIDAIELTTQEILSALRSARVTKWHRLNTATDDFNPKEPSGSSW